MSDSKPKRHPQTGSPMSDKPTQQRVVEQATEASETAKDREERNDKTELLVNERNPAAYDEALAGRELDGGESILSGREGTGSGKAAESVDVPDKKTST